MPDAMKSWNCQGSPDATQSSVSYPQTNSYKRGHQSRFVHGESGGVLVNEKLSKFDIYDRSCYNKQGICVDVRDNEPGKGKNGGDTECYEVRPSALTKLRPVSVGREKAIGET